MPTQLEWKVILTLWLWGLHLRLRSLWFSLRSLHLRLLTAEVLLRSLCLWGLISVLSLRCLSSILRSCYLRLLRCELTVTRCRSCGLIVILHLRSLRRLRSLTAHRLNLWGCSLLNCGTTRCDLGLNSVLRLLNVVLISAPKPVLRLLKALLTVLLLTLTSSYKVDSISIDVNACVHLTITALIVVRVEVATHEYA
jgi:hypothetical protein